MKSLGIPILIVLALFSLWFMQFTMMKRKPVQPGPSRSEKIPDRKNPEEVLKKAGEALKRKSFPEVVKLLEEVKDADEIQRALLLGQAYTALKNSASAAAVLEKLPPRARSPEVLLNLAQADEILGRAEKARKCFEELLETRPGHSLKIKALLGAGRASAALQDWVAAEENFKSATIDDPAQEEPFLELFRVFRNLKKTASLDEIRDKGDPIHGEKFGYNFELGRLYLATGSADKALDLFKKCAEINPKDPTIHWVLFQQFQILGRAKDALKSLETLFDMNRQPPEAVDLPALYFQAALDARTEGRMSASFKFLRGAFLNDKTLMAKDDKGTIAAVGEYIREKGSEEEKVFMTGFTDYLAGDFLKANDTLEKSMGTWKEVRLKADGERLMAECMKLVQKDKDYQIFAAEEKVKAEKTRQEALAHGKSASPPLATQAKPIPSQASQTTAASAQQLIQPEDPRIGEVKKFALTQPQNPRLQYECANQLWKLGDVKSAKGLLGEAIRLNPNMGEAFFLLSMLERSEGNPFAAMKNLESALKIDADNSSYRAFLAQLHNETGDYFAAINEARTALSSDPGNAEARLALAVAFDKSEHAIEALAEVNKALAEENGLAPETRKGLEDLREKLTGKR